VFQIHAPILTLKHPKTKPKNDLYYNGFGKLISEFNQEEEIA
jgi:hypothetical protein